MADSEVDDAETPRDAAAGTHNRVPTWQERKIPGRSEIRDSAAGCRA